MRERQLTDAEQMRRLKEEFEAIVPKQSPTTKMTNTFGEQPSTAEIELEQLLQTAHQFFPFKY